MYTSEFEYHQPDDVAEAVRLLQKNPDAKLLAGGHSLIPTMKLRLANPSALIDVSKIKALRGIRQEGSTIVIGSMTTHYEIETSDLLRGACPMLPETAANVGDPAVRNKGTIGGSLAHSDPAADYPAVVLTLGAKIKIFGPEGAKEVEADNFFQGMFVTAVGPGEILTEVSIPVEAGAKMAYESFTHPASRYSITGVAVVVGKDGVRAAVTGAGPHATRLFKLEEALAGKPLNADTIAAACQGLLEAEGLLSDHFASAEYRAHLVDVLAKRALMRAAGL
jgi:carbon-monoxide dehydrogenase medium subunit